LKVLPLIPQDEMLKYLKSSEVIVGKSGGLTATEVAALGKKAVLLDIMGGQESYNSRFFEQKHLSLMTNDLNQIGTLTERLLHDKKLGDQINKAQAELRAQLKPNVVAQWIAEQRAIPLSRSNLYSLNQRKPAAEALKMSRSIKDCFITQIQIFLFQAPRVVH
jgi:UDP-N-acetylglucosamine:LPS N-acetylglucosamine transferase